MWIYHEPSTADEMPQAESIETLEMPVPQILPEKTASADSMETPVAPAQLQSADLATPHKRFSAADCWMLAGAFLLGTAAAGVICALCSEQQTEWMGYYIQSWLGMFSAADTHSVTALFAAEYFALAGTATLLTLFGFSAFGPILIFLFTMLYGTGNGILLTQLFSGVDWGKKILALVLTALPSAAAAACLCILGAAALRVSGRIRAYSFWSGVSDSCRAGAGVLIGQYLLVLVMLLPLCGVSAGLACLENRLL